MFWWEQSIYWFFQKSLSDNKWNYWNGFRFSISCCGEGTEVERKKKSKHRTLVLLQLRTWVKRGQTSDWCFSKTLWKECSYQHENRKELMLGRFCLSDVCWLCCSWEERAAVFSSKDRQNAKRFGRVSIFGLTQRLQYPKRFAEILWNAN